MHKINLMTSKYSSGQAAIFVFILLIVSLGIVLSLANRTVRDLQSSGGSDFSSRAFAAAEAGAEDALKQSLSTLTGNGTNQYTSTATAFSGSGQSAASFTYIVTPVSTLAQSVNQDYAIQIRLGLSGNSYFSGNLRIFWVNIKDNVTGTNGENISGQRPAIEVTLLKPAISCSTGCDYTAYKAVFNPDSSRTNYFVTPSAGSTVSYTIPGTTVSTTLSVPNYTGGISDTDANGNTTSFNQQYADLLTLNLPNGSENYAYIRIRPLYNKASIAIESGNTGNRNLPAQSYVINSYGSSGTAKRGVQVNKTIPGYPSIFDFVIFNGSTSSVGK